MVGIAGSDDKCRVVVDDFGFIWIGRLAWQNRLPDPLGQSPPYQTLWGVSHIAAVIGAGFRSRSRIVARCVCR